MPDLDTCIFVDCESSVDGRIHCARHARDASRWLDCVCYRMNPLAYVNEWDKDGDVISFDRAFDDADTPISEEDARQKFIDPLLELLGFSRMSQAPLTKPASPRSTLLSPQKDVYIAEFELAPVYGTASDTPRSLGVPDYILFLSVSAVPHLVIEAKPPGPTLNVRSHLDQLRGYLRTTEAPTGALTNGFEWLFYHWPSSSRTPYCEIRLDQDRALERLAQETRELQRQM